MVIGITSSMVCVYICLLIRTFDEGATIGKDNVSKTGTNCILLGTILIYAKVHFSINEFVHGGSTKFRQLFESFYLE